MISDYKILMTVYVWPTKAFSALKCIPHHDSPITTTRQFYTKNSNLYILNTSFFLFNLGREIEAYYQKSCVPFFVPSVNA